MAVVKVTPGDTIKRLFKLYYPNEKIPTKKPITTMREKLINAEIIRIESIGKGKQQVVELRSDSFLEGRFFPVVENDINLEIMAWLPYRDICNALLVCRRLALLSRNGLLWHTHLTREFGYAVLPDTYSKGEDNPRFVSKIFSSVRTRGFPIILDDGARQPAPLLPIDEHPYILKSIVHGIIDTIPALIERAPVFAYTTHAEVISKLCKGQDDTVDLTVYDAVDRQLIIELSKTKVKIADALSILASKNGSHETGFVISYGERFRYVEQFFQMIPYNHQLDIIFCMGEIVVGFGWIIIYSILINNPKLQKVVLSPMGYDHPNKQFKTNLINAIVNIESPYLFQEVERMIEKWDTPILIKYKKASMIRGCKAGNLDMLNYLAPNFDDDGLGGNRFEFLGETENLDAAKWLCERYSYTYTEIFKRLKQIKGRQTQNRNEFILYLLVVFKQKLTAPVTGVFVSKVRKYVQNIIESDMCNTEILDIMLEILTVTMGPILRPFEDDDVKPYYYGKKLLFDFRLKWYHCRKDTALLNKYLENGITIDQRNCNYLAENADHATALIKYNYKPARLKVFTTACYNNRVDLLDYVLENSQGNKRIKKIYKFIERSVAHKSVDVLEKLLKSHFYRYDDIVIERSVTINRPIKSVYRPILAKERPRWLTKGPREPFLLAKITKWLETDSQSFAGYDNSDAYRAVVALITAKVIEGDAIRSVYLDSIKYRLPNITNYILTTGFVL